jgi:hypothetical protein
MQENTFIEIYRIAVLKTNTKYMLKVLEANSHSASQLFSTFNGALLWIIF